MKKISICVWAITAVMIFMGIMSQTVFAGNSASVLSGTVTIADTLGTLVEEGGIVTVTVTSTREDESENIITITNNATYKAKLSFAYSLTEVQEHDFDASNGTYTVVLDTGESVALRIFRDWGQAKTGTLTMSDFSLIEATNEAEVTFGFDSTLGSITVGGVAVSNNSTVAVNADTGVEIVATIKSGTTFLGWVDSTGKVLSTDTTYTLTPSGNTTVKAAFASKSATAWFKCGSYLFDDLNVAIAYAQSAGIKQITVAYSGVLPAGSYSIPNGIVLLVPFDEAATVYKNTAGMSGSYVKPTAYCTLTMASGADISIDGELSVSANMFAAGGNQLNAGSPSGKVGFIHMESGSNITVNSAAKLYVWGYITGFGQITVNSNATVYECFQFMDYLGGTQSGKMKNKVFPASQYYIQNIEVQVKYYAGAIEYAATAVNVSLVGQQQTAVSFIGSSGALFSMSSGYIIKDYDETSDRMIVDVYGSMNISSITMKVAIAEIASGKDVLPINGNMTITLHSGTTTMNQHMALLPGAILNIEENATLKLGTTQWIESFLFWSDTKTAPAELYIYDVDEWGAYYIGQKTYVSPYAPGLTGTRPALTDATIKVDGTLNASNGFLYTTSSGAKIYSTKNGVVQVKSGSSTNTYIFNQSTSDYVTIPIKSAWLANADGSFCKSSDSGNGNGTYNYDASHGRWVKGNHTITSTVTAPTCTTAGYTTHACTCGYTYTDTEVSALGHKYDAVVTAPTCGDKGYTTHTCSVCKDTYTDSEVDALGHNYESVVTAPTCGDKGYTTHTCSVCKDTYTDSEVDALGHKYNSATTDATCTTDGKTVYTCSTCGHSYEEVIPALGHNEISHDAQAPTCTENGWDAYVTCSRCDYTTYREIAAKGHKYNKEVTAPTCTEEGYTTYTCSGCGNSYKDNYVDATGHNRDSTTIDGIITTTCSGCELVEKQLESTLELDYRLNDYIWMNAVITIPANGTVQLDKTYDGTVMLVDAGNGTYYLVRKVLSNELTSEFKVTLSIEGIKTELLDLSFETFANSLPAEHKHKELVTAMINYGKAADDYFDGTKNYGTAAEFDSKTAPVSKLAKQCLAENAYNDVQLKTVGATVDFANCIGLVLRFKTTAPIKLDDGDEIVQIGFMVGDGTCPLTAATAERAYIYYGEANGTDNGFDNVVQNVNGEVGGLVANCPDDLSVEMRLRFDLTNDEYMSRFALRSFVVIKRADGSYVNLYGEQYLYGFEDYCARTYASTSSTASKNLVAYAWEYALAASKADFTEGE